AVGGFVSAGLMSEDGAPLGDAAIGVAPGTFDLCAAARAARSASICAIGWRFDVYQRQTPVPASASTRTVEAIERTGAMGSTRSGSSLADAIGLAAPQRHVSMLPGTCRPHEPHVHAPLTRAASWRYDPTEEASMRVQSFPVLLVSALAM